MAKTFWVETLGCPKNQVDSDKLAGTMLADGLVPARRRRRGRSGRGEHLRLHRGGPPGVDRHRAGAGRRPGRRRPGGRHRLHGRALRRRAGRGPARGRRGRRVRRRLRRRSPTARAGHDRRQAAARRSPAGGAGVRPAQPAPAPLDRAVGLREGGRGLRPGLRVLRHPVVPGQAAQPLAGRSARRGRPARRPARSCSWPRTWPPTGGTRASAGAASSRWCGPSPSGSTGSGCSTSTRRTSPTS